MTRRCFIFSALGGRVFSPGLAVLASGIRNLGVDTTLHSWSTWRDQMLEAEGYNKPADRLILVGYSQGAMRAIQLAENIKPTKVHLLATMVPASNWSIPPNVARVINHTVRNGIFWSGPVYPQDSKVTAVRNIEHFSLFGITHATIQGLPDVHRSIIEGVHEALK